MFFGATNSMTAILHDQPHYSDRTFDKEQTIFGRKEKGLSYDYDDRLWQWDWDKSKEARATAESSGANLHTAQFYQEYLSAYFGKKIILKHIIAGINKSNGYPYLMFGYKEA